MIGKLTTLAICLGCIVVFSDQVNAADHGVMGNSTVTKTAFFQPRPGGVLDVITSPFRPSTYNRGYQSRYGQGASGSTNCVNGSCYTASGNQSPCANGNCGVGNSYGVNYGSGNCPGGNCGVTRYQSPVQYNTGYRGTNGYSAQRYPAYRPVGQPTYRPVSQPVYQSYRPAASNLSRNDPFFP